MAVNADNHADLVKGDTIDPTCMEQGYTEYHCNGCNSDIKKDYITKAPITILILLREIQ